MQYLNPNCPNFCQSQRYLCDYGGCPRLGKYETTSLRYLSGSIVINHRPEIWGHFGLVAPSRYSSEVAVRSQRARSNLLWFFHPVRTLTANMKCTHPQKWMEWVSPCSIYPHKTSPHRMYIDRCRQMPRLPHQVMSKLRVKKLCVCVRVNR